MSRQGIYDEELGFIPDDDTTDPCNNCTIAECPKGCYCPGPCGIKKKWLQEAESDG